MRYQALATDFDGTLAREGRVDGPTLAALGRLKASGRRLVLVTGRDLDALRDVFPEIGLCDRVVAENGALLYRPETREEVRLGEPPPPGFVEELRRRGVGPIAEGRVIVATWDPHEAAVSETIRDFGLDLRVIRNKKAVMVLPSGVDKVTGLVVALEELGLSPRDVVGIGDAENDLTFLETCGNSVAVANALETLKTRVGLVTRGDRGDGVAEVIDLMIRGDLAEESRPQRRDSERPKSGPSGVDQ